MDRQPLFLAIDFGTTNSLLGAASSDEKFFNIPLDPFAADPSLLRTILYFPDGNSCFYGVEAILKFVENDMKGRLFRSFKSHLPNKSYLGSMVDDRVVTLDSMIGIFLLEMKKRAEKHFCREVENVVLGRPARYSTDAVADGFAEYRMKKAAEFAGFKNISFVAEPIAAGYEFRKTLQSEKCVLVADFGGGTSDFTILKIGPGEFKKSDVLAVDGVTLAGDALDGAFMLQKLAPYFGSQVHYRVPLGSNIMRMPPAIHDRLAKPANIVHLKERETYEFLRNAQQWAIGPNDKQRLQRLFVLMEDQQIYSLFDQIEATKRSLSEVDQIDFVFDYPEIDLMFSVTRKDFEQWTDPVVSKIFAGLDRCLQAAGVTESDIEIVCCTGGTAKVPALQIELERRFGKDKMQTSAYFHSVVGGLVEAAQHQMRS